MKWSSFSPLYYHFSKSYSLKSVKPLFKLKGLCAGDSHFKNFGFLYNPTSLVNSILALNDLDDVIECPLILF